MTLKLEPLFGVARKRRKKYVFAFVTDSERKLVVGKFTEEKVWWWAIPLIREGIIVDWESHQIKGEPETLGELHYWDYLPFEVEE